MCIRRVSAGYPTGIRWLPSMEEADIPGRTNLLNPLRKYDDSF